MIFLSYHLESLQFGLTWSKLASKTGFFAMATTIQGSNDVIISKILHQKIPLQILLGQTKSGNQGTFFTCCVLKPGLFHKARPDFFGRLATGVEDTVLSQRS